MTIIITGGSGFLGKYVISSLAKENNIFVLGRSNLKQVKGIGGEIVNYLQTDYSASSLDEIIRRLTPDAIIHMAAQRLNSEKGLEAYICNLRIANNLFEASLSNTIRNIINISTTAIYSSINPLPWAEQMLLSPSNPYGLSKLWTEDSANYFNQKGLFIKTLRIAQVIGIGEREGFLLQKYLKEAISGKALNVYGFCKGKRQYVYAKDVASAIKKAIHAPKLKGTYNIGMKHNYSFLELASIINDTFNNSAPIIHSKDKPADENVYLMDITKAEKELQWQPAFDLKQTYKDILSSLNNQPSDT